ncbi:MAG: DNA-directed RNA polymerase subunit omega [Verrucomicrobia bacterium]|nr:DNA-directed RNA polymerase subunit omega [Verrucomicrobiota bacterium]
MRENYLQAALKVIDDPNILVNVVSLRVKQLKRGNRSLVTSLEKLLPEDTALREIAEGKITYELATAAELAAPRPAGWRSAMVSNVRGALSASAQASKAAALP